ncbi:Phage portal protein, lambda family [Vibrio cholerae]|nr:Phage portal protein, lambda family [Vibrio cholerae]
MWNPFRSAPVQPAVKRKARTAPVFKVSTSRSLFSAADPDRSNSGWTTHPVPIGKMIDQKASRSAITIMPVGLYAKYVKTFWVTKGLCCRFAGKSPMER